MRIYDPYHVKQGQKEIERIYDPYHVKQGQKQIVRIYDPYHVKQGQKGNRDKSRFFSFD